MLFGGLSSWKIQGFLCVDVTQLVSVESEQ